MWVAFFEITVKSQFSGVVDVWMSLSFVDSVLAATAFLLVLTIAITLVYYGRIRRVSRAYEEAKSVVSDIVISFDRQLNRQEEHLGTVAQKVELATAKSEKLETRFEEQESRYAAYLSDLPSKMAGSQDIGTLKMDLEDVKKQVGDLVKAQEELKQQAATAISDMHMETPIPIKKERALAPLTSTELRVLELIAEAGEKTAPEIKEAIKLTREHTARLMKKLYEDGYLERRSEKTPFAYRVKEEMLKIMKKNEVKP